MQGIWVSTMRFLLDIIGPEDEDEDCESNDCADFEHSLDDDLAGDLDFEDDE